MKKILILLLALLLLAGCGQKSDDTPAGGDTAVATSATIATDTDVNTMDSSIATDGTSFIAITLCMSGLTQLDEAGVPVPDLAESWTVSEDGLKYEFTIRDASWSNGTKITANDFVYGWSRLFDPNTASDYAFLKDTCHIVNFYADGDSKFVVELDIPCDFLLSLCAFPSFFALNEEFVEAQGDQYSLTVDNMIYSGPYKMASWTLGDSYTFEKNESYWDAASYAENVDTITFRLIQGQSAILDYEAGNIDYVKLTSEVIDDYADREDVVTYASGYAWYLSLNYHNEYLANAKVRQAIAYAVNTEEMCDTVLKDGSVALKGIVSSNFAVNPDGKDYRDIAGQMTLGYDVDKAKALVEEAKAELGVDKIELELMYEDSDVTKNVSQYIMNALEEAGFSTVAKCEPKKTRLQDMQNDNYTFAVHRWGPDYADPQTYIDLFTTGASNNYGHFENAAYDELVEKACFGEDAANGTQRWLDMVEAERILINEEVAIIPLYQAGNTALMNPGLSGIQYHAGGVDNYRHMVK